MFDFNIQRILLMLPAVLIGMTVHEFAHAWMAVRLGDALPRQEGRLTLNPLVHIDPVGIFLLLFAGFGWAKPVRINTQAYRHPRRDAVAVSVAGVSANLLFAVIFTAVLKFGILFWGRYLAAASWGGTVLQILSYCVWINIILAVFNLIPLPPLDGSHVVMSLIPESRPELRLRYQRIGGLVLVVLILLSFVAELNVLPIGTIAGSMMNASYLLFGL